MKQRVEDAGASEGHLVMKWIGIQDLSHAKAGRLPAGVSLQEKMANRSKWESKWQRWY
jgi:hypothetical protein